MNIAAAVAAALLFGLWKGLETTPKPEGLVLLDGSPLYELVDDVGYIPKANAQATLPAKTGGPTAKPVTYTTGPDHFRIVPTTANRPEACVLLFGASFTFGNGVQDEETYAAQLVRLSGGRLHAHNFGVSGWGLHQTLAGLQSGRFQRAVRCEPTDAVFLMVPSLIWWTSGVLNPWDKYGPRYRLGSDGKPVRDGNLGMPDSYNWRSWIGLTPTSRGDALALSKAIIVESMSELRRHYPDIRTQLISYRVSSWADVDFSAEDMLGFEYELHQAGITPLPLEGIIPRYRFAQADYILGAPDYHPNARAHRLIAEFILRQIQSRPLAPDAAPKQASQGAGASGASSSSQ